MHPLSSAPASGTPRLGSGNAGPRGATPSYLSPAFQLAAMEQEVQMAHASAAAAQQGGGANGDTPLAAPGWHADDASELGQGGNSSLVRTVHAAPLARRASCMLHEQKEPRPCHATSCPTLAGPPASAVYNALTATAKKLADKPSFMEAYRQKFPHISECWGLLGCMCSEGCTSIGGPTKHHDVQTQQLHSPFTNQTPTCIRMCVQWRPRSGCCRLWRSSAAPPPLQQWRMRRQPLGPWRR